MVSTRLVTIFIRVFAPTFDGPALGGCHRALSNEFKVIALDHRKLADWGNLASASTG